MYSADKLWVIEMFVSLVLIQTICWHGWSKSINWKQRCCPKGARSGAWTCLRRWHLESDLLIDPSHSNERLCTAERSAPRWCHELKWKLCLALPHSDYANIPTDRLQQTKFHFSKLWKDLLLVFACQSLIVKENHVVKIMVENQLLELISS